MDGRLIIVSAPSGAGKTTIVNRLLEKYDNLEFSISATTRMPRNNEENGRDYYFMPPREFKERIQNNEFIEYEQVYHNQYYGTLKTELNRIWEKGNNVIFDVDVVGGLNIKKQFPVKGLALFIMPPSVEVLEKRLFERTGDEQRSIRQRLNKAKQELTYAHHFDEVIVNEELEEAVKEALESINKFLKA